MQKIVNLNSTKDLKEINLNENFVKNSDTQQRIATLIKIKIIRKQKSNEIFNKNKDKGFSIEIKI